MRTEQQAHQIGQSLEQVISDLHTIEREVQSLNYQLQAQPKKKNKKLVERLYNDVKEMDFLFDSRTEQEFLFNVKATPYFASVLMEMYGDKLLEKLNKNGRLSEVWRIANN